MSLKNAPFQRNQLARYVKRLSENFQIYNIYLVILPQLCGNSKIYTQPQSLLVMS